MTLPPLIQVFVPYCGDRDSRRSPSRTLGRICALRCVTRPQALCAGQPPQALCAELPPQALCADQTSKALRADLPRASGIDPSRNPREWQGGGLVPRYYRRDFHTTRSDIWIILRGLAEERKKREVDPILSVLRDNLMEVPETAPGRLVFARQVWARQVWTRQAWTRLAGRLGLAPQSAAGGSGRKDC